ncbi:MAG: class I SAM-dependent methyltransferase [Pseudomonadota bacterium]|jgi:cyclopropane-fatty-acyl-phospholipid synthase
MRDFAAAQDTTAPASEPGGFFRRRMRETLAGLRGCELTVAEDGATHMFGIADPGVEPLRATITVGDADMYRQMALNGSVGAAEAYMDGLWECSDLTALVRIFVRNRDLLDRMEGGLARLGGALMRAWHSRRRNSRGGSRRNIAEHYDLGNDLFRLFLDESMMYSSAIHVAADEPLEAAQFRKLERICRKLDLKASDHLVEIGTGWGGMALHAAKHHGCRVTTTTISKEQHALAVERIAAAGLSDRVTVLLEDYRDLKGRYDKLVSIEMIEAIGHQFIDTYFGKVSALLAPHGLGLIQAITIEDHRYERALRNVDFIQRYIFPGSFIPSIAAMTGAMARSTDLKLFHLEDIGPSYAVTLRQWRERFDAKLDQVRALGYPDRFVRMWHFYLAYCEGGFIERSIGDVQLLLAKPGARPKQFLPDLEPAL